MPQPCAASHAADVSACLQHVANRMAHISRPVQGIEPVTTTAVPMACACLMQWGLAFGRAWEHLEGETSGQTQTATGRSPVWAHPLDAHFLCKVCSATVPDQGTPCRSCLSLLPWVHAHCSQASDSWQLQCVQHSLDGLGRDCRVSLAGPSCTSRSGGRTAGAAQTSAAMAFAMCRQPQASMTWSAQPGHQM